MDSAASSVAGEDQDALLAAGLAKEAAALFQSGNFTDCLRILNQLLERKDYDPKVHHNKAIAESLRDGCPNPRRLIKALENIKELSEDLSRESREQFEAFSNIAYEHNEFDTLVMAFNIAALWYHIHEYARSFSYLDTFYQGTKPIGEGIALRMCLLLLDVALLSHNASGSADLIRYMEKVFSVSDPSNQVDSSNQTIVADDSTSNTSEDLRLKLHLYKVRFLLLTRNLKEAMREVKEAIYLARGKDYHLALYLKSQLQYAQRNHSKSIKILMASVNYTEMGISSMYYNDLGCIYYRLGKRNASGIFFSKALSSSSVARKEKRPKLLPLSQDKSLFVTYNCGVQSLACGRPFHAARCFQMAIPIFNKRPLLWLRIAECCLMALDKGLIKSISSASNISDIIVNVNSKGKWRHLSLRYVGIDSSVTIENRQPDLSMSLAWQSLVNALLLLDSSEANNFKAKENESSCILTSSILDYERIQMKEKLMMRQAVLADLAFVELALGDPSKALSTGKSLIKLADCSKMYIFLGTIYAAEALCMLNKPKEAAELLARYMSNGDDVKLPYSQDDSEKWTVEEVANSNESPGSAFSRPEEARGLFCANYAANLALVGELEQAQRFLSKAFTDIPNSSQAIVTAIYVDMKCGKTEAAVAKLRKHRGIRFLPTNC